MGNVSGGIGIGGDDDDDGLCEAVMVRIMPLEGEGPRIIVMVIAADV